MIALKSPKAALLAAVALSTLLHINAASAQEAQATASDAAEASTPSTGGDIVVTAQRREASLQATPVAVTAFSSTTIANYGIRAFGDFAKSVPSLSYGTGGSTGTATQGYGISSTRQVTIRGVAGNNTTSLYIDDTPIPAAVDVRVLDLGRIEVLRGPQGTLFGAASMGGTIKLVTKQPDLQNSTGEITVKATSVAHAGAGYDASATLNIPLVKDNLSLRVSGYSTFDPGFYEKTYGVGTVPGVAFPVGAQVSGTRDHIGENRSYGGTAALHFAPESVPGLQMTATAIYQSSRTDGYPLADFDPTTLQQIRPYDVAEKANASFQFYSLTARYALDFGSIISSSSYFKRKAFDLEDGTAFLANAAPFFYGYTNSPYLPATATDSFNQKIVTQELRFESDFNSPLGVVAGIFYQRSKNGYDYLLGGNVIDNAGQTQFGYYRTSGPNVQTQLAGFVDLSYNVTPDFKLSAGVRVASQKFRQHTLRDGFMLGSVDTVDTQKDSPVTPRFLAEYHFSRSDMIYASASKGFRPGGANSPIPSPCDPESFGFKQNSSNPYNSDSIWSYEAGMKNGFLDNRILTRVAAYRIDWNNIQQTVGVPTCGLQGTLNVGTARIEGAEAEVNVTPVDGLSLNGSLSYTDARITKAGEINGTIIGLQPGEPVNGVPKWSGSMRAEYGWTVGSTDLFIRSQYSYTGSSISFANGARIKRNAYELVDLRAGFSRDNWTVTLFAANVFDVKPNLGNIVPAVGQGFGTQQFIIGTPRTIGLELRRTF